MAENDNSLGKWGGSLIFAFLTVPFLLSYGCSERQDCYQSHGDCSSDWGSEDCKPNPESHCPFIGRSYAPMMMMTRGYAPKHSTGIRRSGFGSTGRGFFSGG